MNKTKRWIAIALAAATVFSGCSAQKQEIPEEVFGPGSSGGRTSTGEKYVERTKKMPYENGTEELISLDKDTNGKIHVISMDEKCTYHDYTMDSLAEGEPVYEMSEIAWLHELAPDFDSWVIDVKLDTNNNPVACVGTADGKWMIAKEGAKTAIDNCPGGIAVTADDHVILPYDQKGSVIDWDGKDVYQFDKGRAPSTVSQAADTYQTYIACKNKKEDAVVVYDYAEKTKVAEIPYAFNPDEDIIIRFDEQGNIYIVDEMGIHKANMTDSSFITLMDGMTSSIGITSSMVTAMEIDSEGNIWCVIKDFNTGTERLYCYACVKVEGIEGTLTLYTMKESDWLKKLVIDFQSEYPQYVVNMVVDDDKAMTSQDKLRNLNAQLLSGEGPDILMLDGLPIDSYVEKGILTDISECVEKSDVIEGVKNTAKTENGTFVIATRMGIPVMLDHQGEAKKFESIDSLLQALQKKDILLPAIEADALAELLSVIYYDELFTPDGNLDETRLDSLIEVMKLMKANGYVGEIDEFAQDFMEKNSARQGLSYLPSFGWNESLTYDLAVEEANVALTECSTIDLGVLGIASKLDKNMSVLKNLYFPYGQLGVNSGSNSQDVAKQFISFALSEQEQSSYVEDGVPVTLSGLDSLSKVKNPNVAMGLNLADGSELELLWPEESEISRFAELCKKVEKGQQMQQVIAEMIKMQCREYLTGEASEDEISENIKNQIRTYLEEQK